VNIINQASFKGLLWPPLASNILSWIRSDACPTQFPAGRFVVESTIGLGASIFVAWFSPHSIVSWATAIWIFFLSQALFFVLFDNIESTAQERIVVDPFERVHAKAEEIMTRAMP